MESKNIMEELVEKRVDELMGMVDMCRCAQCCADVRALALNNLPPRYVVNKKGDVFTRFRAQTNQGQVEIAGAIIRAIEVVRLNPRHEDDVQSL